MAIELSWRFGCPPPTLRVHSYEGHGYYCLGSMGSSFHQIYAEYRLGTDAKKEDWTRGLELMVAESRTVQFLDGGSPETIDPDP